ncbi:MAG: DNA-directed RNA polymerase subunit P [Candidatus Aenigmarchaeota archaeon]|nr:DNA-directed RNA polymerase subunit P [Candidatus Aenigmarchaeota archaeon]
MSFKCLKCGKIIEKFERKIRCPYCGYRIFVKQRPKIVKRVQAR